MNNNASIKFIGFDAEFAIKEILELSVYSLQYPGQTAAGKTVAGDPGSETARDADKEEISREVFHQYFKPRHEQRWPGSERVHHISPAMVRHRPYFIKFRPMVQQLIDEADCLVGFAIDNDIEALKFAGVERLDRKPYIDIRDLHWLCRGREAGIPLDSRRGLSATAEELGIEFSETAAHGASYDTRKTMECLHLLLNEFEEKFPENEKNSSQGNLPGLLARYLQVWEREKEKYYREYAKGWIALVDVGDGYRLKPSRLTEPTGAKVVATIPVNARYRALDEIDARFDKRRHKLDRRIYCLTDADIKWFKSYVNEYDGQEPLHRKMQELRGRSSL